MSLTIHTPNHNPPRPVRIQILIAGKGNGDSYGKKGFIRNGGSIKGIFSIRTFDRFSPRFNYEGVIDSTKHRLL